jgi:5-methylcytosine-specific restriction endonuclease McrA
MQKAPAWNLRTRAVGQLRRLWRFSPDVKNALSKARSETSSKPKLVGYACAVCGLIAKREDVAVDHIVPVVPTSGWESWDSFVARLFCGSQGLQVLCHFCHDAKTAAERSRRTAARRRVQSEG